MNNKLLIITDNDFFEYNIDRRRLRKYNKLEKDNNKWTNGTKLFKNNYHLLLVGSKNIYQLDTINHTLKKVSIPNVPEKWILDMVQCENTIYVLCEDYGLLKLDARTLQKTGESLMYNELYKYTNSNEYRYLVALKNKVYISYSKGIVEYDPFSLTIKTILLSDANKDLRIQGLYNIDDNLIISTYVNGFYILPFSIKKFNSNIPPDVQRKLSNPFFIDEYLPGKILVGGDHQMLLYNFFTNSIEEDYTDIFKNYFVLCGVKSSDKDKYYIGTYQNGLLIFDLKNKRVENLIKKVDILSLLLDDDILWIGTVQDGLYKYDLKNKKTDTLHTLEHLTINRIAKAQDGTYWVATMEAGLLKITPSGKILKHLNKENGALLNNSVYSLYEDHDTLYIATERGLAVYDKTKNQSYFFSDNNGLSSPPVILSLIKDSKNNLWMNTINGITKIDLDNINKPHHKLFYNYSHLDGLVNYEYNQGAFCLLSDGYLCYGGVDGIDIFNPTQIKPFLNPVPVYVTAFRKYGKEYETDTNVFLKKFYELDWKQNNFQVEVTAINLFSSHTLYRYRLSGYDDDFSEPSNVRYISYTGLPGGTYKLEILATNHDGQWNPVPQYIYIKVVPPFWKTTWFIVSASALLFGGIFGFNQYRTYQVKKRNKELEEKVKERTKELSTKNSEILSSIEYAKRIQQAILPTNKYIQDILPNSFILYQPKDIVSGDFYWIHAIAPNKNLSETSIIVAAVDCTGHGVPGALMSMIGNNLLNQIVIEKNITAPEQILKEMNKGVQLALKQGQSDINNNDGMDASILHIFKDGTIQWAGAYRPLIIIRANGEIQKIEGDKYPIGGVQISTDRDYTLHTIQLQKNDSVYLFSDGYVDQFGGEKGRKMMMKRFIEQLKQIHLKPVHQQKEIMETFFNQWKGNHEQIDDVLLIGIKYS